MISKIRYGTAGWWLAQFLKYRIWPLLYSVEYMKICGVWKGLSISISTLTKRGIMKISLPGIKKYKFTSREKGENVILTKIKG